MFKVKPIAAALGAELHGVDLCNDNVSKHLELESATIKGVQEALKHTLRESSEEIRTLQKTKSEIEKDLLDKEAAMDIDEQTARLKITAPKKRTETGRTSNRYFYTETIPKIDESCHLANGV